MDGYRIKRKEIGNVYDSRFKVFLYNVANINIYLIIKKK